MESDWTVETLKESVDQRFADNQKAIDTAMTSQEKAVSAALLAAKEAVIKAEISTEKRFDSVNEFRGQLADQSSTLLPRAEYIANHKALEDKIAVVTLGLNRSQGEKVVYATHADVAAAVDKLEQTIRPLIDFVSGLKGQTHGSQITMGKIYASIAAVGTILGIVIVIATQLGK